MKQGFYPDPGPGSRRILTNLSTYKILFLGDIVGKPGRVVVKERLPDLVSEHKPLFVIANGENAAAGMGITSEIAEELYALGVDGITLGNHTFNKREIIPYIQNGKPIIRPSNLPKAVPGSGLMRLKKDGIELAVINLSGRVYMDPHYADPFAESERLLAGLDTNHIFVDFHAEATSEKIAMGWHLAGRVSAVVGTHTHVQTADEQVLEGGTAYISDVGMTGPWPSVLGMEVGIILERFRTSMPVRFEVAREPGVICGVIVDVERDTGKATGIARLRVE